MHELICKRIVRIKLTAQFGGQMHGYLIRKIKGVESWSVYCEDEDKTLDPMRAGFLGIITTKREFVMPHGTEYSTISSVASLFRLFWDSARENLSGDILCEFTQADA